MPLTLHEAASVEVDAVQFACEAHADYDAIVPMLERVRRGEPLTMADQARVLHILQKTLLHTSGHATLSATMMLQAAERDARRAPTVSRLRSAWRAWRDG